MASGHWMPHMPWIPLGNIHYPWHWTDPLLPGRLTDQTQKQYGPQSHPTAQAV